MQYRDAGCYILKNNQTYDETLVKGYAGKVCEVGCRFFNNDTCDAHLRMVAIQPLSATTVIYSNTVKDEAKRLNISVSEVRRRRAGQTPRG